MRRVVTPELLDSDAGTPSEIDAAMTDLRRFSRWLGGTSTLCSMLSRVLEATGRRELSLLDVAAGPAEASLAAMHRLDHHGIRVHLTLLDRSVTHLPKNGVRTLAGDALALPFSDGTFDVVTCSLFLHHLEPDESVRFLNEALRVCRHAVLVNDVRRHPVHLALSYAVLPLYRSRLTRHDAPASIRRAYTAEEVRSMLAQSNAARIDIASHYLFRMAVIAWKEARA